MIEDNSFDLAIGIILLIIGLFSFLKGFSKDFSSTLSWVISIVLSHLFGSTLLKLFAPELYNSLLVRITSYSIFFVVILIITSILISKLLKPILEKIPKTIDQSFGFLFGFFKGYMMLSFVFGIIIAFYSANIFFTTDQEKAIEGRYGPDWLQTSKSYAILEFGSSKLDFIINDILPDLITNDKDETKKETKDNLKDRVLQNITKEIISSEKDANDIGGYKKSDVKNMEKIINIISTTETE